MRSFEKFLTGFILGGIAGALVVLLYTPESGDKMRGRLKDNYYLVRDEVKNAARQRSEELKQELARLQQKS
ncbi:MAG TPA: YtxH domain-containing protein [Anaerolineaceae bacterium]|nr:YtxH domain-containing protein [Anaerolineaceae bacterium]